MEKKIRKVFCNWCKKNADKGVEISALSFPIDDFLSITVEIDTRQQKNICNKCRRKYFNKFENLINKIKEEFENGKNDTERT